MERITQLKKCLTCGANGWLIWSPVETTTGHKTLVWSACADCNDDEQKPKPIDKELTRLITLHQHAVAQAEFHYKDQGPALYGGDIMWLMGFADWAAEAFILEEKITLYLRLLNV